MSDFSKKSSFAQNLGSVVRYLNDSDNEGFGWELPCTVASVNKAKSIVVVDFAVIGSDGNPLDLPQATVPVSGWKYIRYPIKAGDPGVVISIDTNTQNIAKLVPGTTSLISHGNLGPTLLFVPIMQADWSDSEDTDAVVISAPNGSIIRTDNGDGKITVNKDNIIVNYKGKKITLNSTGVTIDANVTINGNISVSGTSNLQGTTTIQGKQFLTHKHTGVTTGVGTTGGVS